jgi:hypothetical protein
MSNLRIELAPNVIATAGESRVETVTDNGTARQGAIASLIFALSHAA